MDGDLEALRVRYMPEAPEDVDTERLFELISRKAIREAFLRQLVNMSRVEVQASERRAHNMPPRYRFTGKTSREDKDDLVMALGIAQVASHRHLVAPGLRY